MNENKPEDEMPWWEKELSVLQGEHAAYLRRRLPGLYKDHEDLVSDTSFALIGVIRQNSSTLPNSWFRFDILPTDPERDYLHKLGMVILKRRIADLFRRRASRSGLFDSMDFTELTVPIKVSPDRKILLTQILQLTLIILDKMKVEDRDLIALAAQSRPYRNNLTERDRQRLHRIRRKLKDELARRLGFDLAALLTDL